jgi:hypothetical protein
VVGRPAAQILETVFGAPQSAIRDELERTVRRQELIHKARDGLMSLSPVAKARAAARF